MFLFCLNIITLILHVFEVNTCKGHLSLSYLLSRSVRFTQQLVLFAPQAVSVHSHVKTLLRTLSSRQVAYFNHIYVSLKVTLFLASFSISLSETNLIFP